jgi:hypothetical protein
MKKYLAFFVIGVVTIALMSWWWYMFITDVKIESEPDAEVSNQSIMLPTSISKPKKLVHFRRGNLVVPIEGEWKDLACIVMSVNKSWIEPPEGESTWHWAYSVARIEDKRWRYKGWKDGIYMEEFVSAQLVLYDIDGTKEDQSAEPTHFKIGDIVSYSGYVGPDCFEKLVITRKVETVDGWYYRFEPVCKANKSYHYNSVYRRERDFSLWNEKIMKEAGICDCGRVIGMDTP